MSTHHSHSRSAALPPVGRSSVSPRQRFGQRTQTTERSAQLLKEISKLQARLRLLQKEVDAMAPQKREAANPVAAMVKKGQLLDAGAFAEAMNWTRQALSKALAANRVFFIEAEGVRHYPAFFMDGRYDRRHLEKISKVLGDLPGGAKLQFFTTPKGSLGGKTPLDALAKGNLHAVQTAAEGFAKG